MGVDRLRVNRLRLRAGQRDAVRAVLPDLEDAFRTASWPTGPRPGGLLQIRRLDLGRIAPGASRQSLAQRLTAAVGGAQLVHAVPGRPVPDAAMAVLWQGPVEHLAAALIVAETRPGPRPWWVAGILPPDLSARAGLPKALARICGKSDIAQGPVLDGLASCLLACAAPPEVIALVADALLRAEVDTVARTAGMRAPVLWPDPEPQRPGAPAQDLETLLLAPEGQRAEGTGGRVLEAARRVAAMLPPALGSRRRAALALAVLRARHGPMAQTALAHELSRRRVDPAPAALPRAVPRGAVPRDVPRDVPSSPRRSAPVADLPRTRTPKRAARSAQTRDNVTVPPEPSLASVRVAGEQRTRLGGVCVLIALMNRAGLPAYDAALGMDLTLSVLRACLARRAAPDDDLLRALPEPLGVLPDDMPPGLLCQPATWALAGPVHVARLRGQRGRAVLSLGRRHAPFAVIDRAGLRDLRGRGVALRKGVGRWDWAGLRDSLPGGLHLFLNRLCRRTLGRALVRVLDRPAWLGASATHLDVTCDLNGVRIDERRAGLDFSPGWVPWLARVVSLHFEPFATDGRVGEARHEP